METLDAQSMLGQNFEPNRPFRFILGIQGVDAFLVKSSGRPGSTTDEVEMGYINNTRYVAGKTKPNTIAITLYDAIDPSASQKVMEWVRLQYDPATGRAAYQQYYKKDITLKMLGPVGDVVGMDTIYGAFITEHSPSELDYTSGGDVATIAITIRYDRSVKEF
jgi:hypothetical protein